MTSNQKNRVIEIIVSGKGVIPYEKIETIESLSFIKPEDGIFFSKDEFFSSLKGKEIDEESYENAKQLFIILKMRNLSDLNDLYNAQDVIILLEIIENRFQIIQDKTSYNPRIINSASKLSGCIQREKLKFNLLLEKVSFEDPIGHLFIVDIEFDEENASKKQFMYNEIFPPIIEKEKIMDANGRSLYQLLELFETSSAYRCTAKSHATMFPKKCIPLYYEDLRFLIKRAG